MSRHEFLFQRRVARADRRRALFADRLGRVLFGGVIGLSLLAIALTGCSTSKGVAAKPALGPLFPKSVESKAEKEALRKAVEKDPFPRAKSRPVDLDA